MRHAWLAKVFFSFWLTMEPYGTDEYVLAMQARFLRRMNSKLARVFSWDLKDTQEKKKNQILQAVGFESCCCCSCILHANLCKASLIYLKISVVC